jgi:hypothetical protein
MGLRGFQKGRERIQLDDQFVDPSGSSVARVTIELPGRARLDGMRADELPILFDCVTARTAATGLSDRDQVLLETFAVDSIEGLFSLAGQGSDVRLFGRGFGPDPATVLPGEDPPYYDILEVTGPIPGRPGIQSRRYYFDTKTRLLTSVRYTGGGRRIEARYSNWAQVDDSAYPGLIERFEASTLVFACWSSVISNSSRPSRAHKPCGCGWTTQLRKVLAGRFAAAGRLRRAAIAGSGPAGEKECTS